MAVVQQEKVNNKPLQKTSGEKTQPSKYCTQGSVTERLCRSLGNQRFQRLLSDHPIQAKLKIGSPNDKYEQEADKVAEQIIRMPVCASIDRAQECGMPGHRASSVPDNARLQDRYIARQITPLALSHKQARRMSHSIPFEHRSGPVVRRPRKQGRDEEEIPQAKGLSPGMPEINTGLGTKIQSLQRGGQALPALASAFFEPRFGCDFSQVRLHTDRQAATLARMMNARAFTLGNNIVVDPRYYSPRTREGKQLLAHELTHVVQQRHSTGAGQHIQRFPVGPFDVRGNGDLSFEAMVARWLHLLNGTSQGSALFQEIENNRGRRIRIEPRAYCGFSGNMRNFIGFNAWGCVNPSTDRCPGDPAGLPPAWMNVPRYINLFHECVHIYLQLTGRGSHPQRECMVTGLGNYFSAIPYNENRLRCELGYPVRPCYFDARSGLDYCPGLNPPACSAAATGAGILQPKLEAGHNININSETESGISASGSGQPLPTSVRDDFEPRFNQNFNHVRVHTGNDTTQLAREMHAQAFTVNNHIFFNRGNYDPGSHAGRRLLAHELTHVVQQTGRGGTYAGAKGMLQKTDDRQLPAPLTDNEWTDVVQPALTGAQTMLNSAIQVIQEAEESVPEPRGPETTADQTLASVRMIQTWFGSSYWEHIQSIREIYQRILQTVNSFARDLFTVVTNAEADSQGSADGVAYVNCNNPEQGVFLANRYFGRTDNNGSGLEMAPVLNSLHQARILIHETAHLHFLHCGHAGGEFPEQTVACNEGLNLTYRQAIQNPYAWDHFAYCAQGGILPMPRGRLETLIEEIRQRRAPSQ